MPGSIVKIIVPIRYIQAGEITTGAIAGGELAGECGEPHRVDIAIPRLRVFP